MYISVHVHASRSRQWTSLVLVSCVKKESVSSLCHLILLSYAQKSISDAHHDSSSTNVTSVAQGGAGVGSSGGGSSTLHTQSTTLTSSHDFREEESCSTKKLLSDHSIYMELLPAYLCFWFSPSGIHWVKYMNLIVPTPEDIFNLLTESQITKREGNTAKCWSTRDSLPMMLHPQWSFCSCCPRLSAVCDHILRSRWGCGTAYEGQACWCARKSESVAKLNHLLL